MGAKNGNVARPASPRMQTVCIGSKSSDFPLLPFICKMEEAFELPVLFNGQNLLLPAQLQAWGYSHRILVRLKDQTLILNRMRRGTPCRIIRSGRTQTWLVSHCNNIKSLFR